MNVSLSGVQHQFTGLLNNNLWAYVNHTSYRILQPLGGDSWDHHNDPEVANEKFWISTGTTAQTNRKSHLKHTIEIWAPKGGGPSMPKDWLGRETTEVHSTITSRGHTFVMENAKQVVTHSIQRITRSA